MGLWCRSYFDAILVDGKAESVCLELEGTGVCVCVCV
jgi:hypothetical protein